MPNYLVISTSDSNFEPTSTFLEAANDKAITKLIKKELKTPTLSPSPLEIGDFETHVLVINLDEKKEVLRETFNYDEDGEDGDGGW
jgi:hypothetical protein